MKKEYPQDHELHQLVDDSDMAEVGVRLEAAASAADNFSYKDVLEALGNNDEARCRLLASAIVAHRRAQLYVRWWTIYHDFLCAGTLNEPA